MPSKFSAGDSRGRSGFEVLQSVDEYQVAAMVLMPGELSGDYGNEHPTSAQILFVVSGEGAATVAGERFSLSTGDVLVIEAEEDHQIRCTGAEPLTTMNVYVPPAYDEQGEPL